MASFLCPIPPSWLFETRDYPQLLAFPSDAAYGDMSRESIICALPSSTPIPASVTPHQAKYLAHELTRRGPSDSIEKFAGTLADAKVDMNPHQVEAALFAFKSPLSKGAILADEVGLGKTIEAGILLSQFWAENRRRILLIMPASLRKQWTAELAEKFYLPSIILEGPSFNKAIKAGKANPFDRNGKELVICSYQFAAGRDELLMATHWDLVVIDEAHRLRNVYKNTNKGARRLRTALNGTRKVLLTATPLQNNLLELYGLVSFIDEHAFGDKRSFSSQYNRSQTEESYSDLKDRLAPYCLRTLRRQVTEYVSYTARSALTQEFTPSKEEQELYDLVSQYLQREELFALPPQQRHLVTLILRKLLASSSYAIAGALDSMHRRLSKVLKEDTAVRDTLPDEIDEDTDGEFTEEESEWAEDQPDEDIEPLSAEERAALEQEICDLAAFRDRATSITENAKGEALLAALETGFDKMRDNNAPDKAIVFTESRRTQNYLVRRLTEAGYGDELVLFNGSNSDEQSRGIYAKWKEENADTDSVSGSRTADMRQALVDHFRNSARIMIATEAAAEGINLQFCSLLINFDLPWNPQRIEQRIGRCHRYGQKHDVVVINFLNTKNAADRRVYELLDEKLQLFNGVFGSSDEILGTLESGVDFENRVAEIYQRCRRPEEIQAAFDALQGELDEQIQSKLQDTRASLLENFDTEVADKLRIYKTKGTQYLNKLQTSLWSLTMHMLGARVMFDPAQHFFNLSNQPYPGLEVPLGRYELTTGKDGPEHAHRYRLHHPLAQAVIDEAKTLATPAAHLTFNYSETPGQSAKLAPLVGSIGHLSATLVTVTTGPEGDHRTHEDQVLLTAITSQGEKLTFEQAHALFGLPADASPIRSEVPPDLELAVEDSISFHFSACEAHHGELYERERQKLDNWADDQIKASENELRKTKADIRELRNASLKSKDLKEKAEIETKIRDLEKKQRRLRQTIFDVEDEILAKRDALIEDIHRRLVRQNHAENLFTIEFSIA